MVAQLSLDRYLQSLPRSRTGDQSTSVMAGHAAGFRASAGRLLALRTLAEHIDGLTDFELAELTHVPQTSIGKRRGECAQAGLVEAVMVSHLDRITTLKRYAPSGALAIVWKITAAGLEYLNGGQLPD